MLSPKHEAERFRAGFLTRDPGGTAPPSAPRLPDLAISGVEAPVGPLQWRDRGGFSPLFPFTPHHVGTRKLLQGQHGAGRCGRQAAVSRGASLASCAGCSMDRAAMRVSGTTEERWATSRSR
jgi:hypothetical protein